MRSSPVSLRTRLTRVGIIALSLAGWFWTQSLIGVKPLPEGTAPIRDAVHDLTAPLHAWLSAHGAVADALLISSSLGIDALALFLMAWAVCGPSLRPFVGVMAVFAARQVCQAIVSLPAPEGVIWHHPGFPSLLVTYGVANDFFFSGHTALATLGCLELAARGRRWILPAAALGVFEMGTVLVLRAHYTMDVVAGAAVAALVWLVVRTQWRDAACPTPAAGQESAA